MIAWIPVAKQWLLKTFATAHSLKVRVLVTSSDVWKGHFVWLMGEME